VSERIHTLATLLVAVGTSISAFWILALNSWMQTPVGFEMRNGQAHATDWLAILFNPSLPYRLTHMLLASGLTVSFLVAGLSAYRWLRGDRGAGVMAALKTGVVVAAILIPIQIFVGDLHGLNTLKHQPAKIAAMEGHWQNEGNEGVPLIVFGWPDMEREETRFKVEIPRLGSLILTHSLNGTFPGLKEYKKEDRPNSTIVFWSFRVMVGLGLLMILLGLISVWLRWRGRMETCRPFLHFALWMGPMGIVALLAGWFTTEIGRQPWTVYNVMRTADAVSGHGAAELGLTLVIFVVVYFAVFGTGFAYLCRLIRKGPLISEGQEAEVGGPGQGRTPARPLSVARKSDRDDASKE
jgi:cytochrome d ubiquinol oxidase subunit I